MKKRKNCQLNFCYKIPINLKYSSRKHDHCFMLYISSCNWKIMFNIAIKKKCLYSSSFLIPLSWGKPPTTSGFSFGFLDQHKNIFIFLYVLWLLHHHNDEATNVSSSPVSSSDLQGSLDGSKSTKSFASIKVVCNCFQKRCF